MNLEDYIKWRTDPVRLAAIEERKKAAKAKAQAIKEKAKAFDTVRKAEIKQKADLLIRESEERVQQILAERELALVVAAVKEQQAALAATEKAKESAAKLKMLESAENARIAGEAAAAAEAAQAAKAAQAAIKEAEEAAQAAKEAEETRQLILNSPKFKKLTKKAQVRFLEEGLGPEELCKRDVLVALEVAARR